MNRDSFK